MKILGFIGLLIAGLLVYGYFFDHSFLRNVGLGGLISAEASKADDDRAAQAREAAIQSRSSASDGGGLVKCVDGNGHVTFTQGACAGGGTGHSVQLHETEILHAGGGQSSSSSQQAQSSSSPAPVNAPEDHKHNAMGAINEKFLPQ